MPGRGKNYSMNPAVARRRAAESRIDTRGKNDVQPDGTKEKVAATTKGKIGAGDAADESEPQAGKVPAVGKGGQKRKGKPEDDGDGDDGY